MPRLKIFALYARGYWLHKASWVRRQVIEAMIRHKDVLCLVSGPGWDYYDESATLQENIDRLLPGADVCFIYKPEGSPRQGVPAVREAEKVKALKVVRMHECWWDNRDVKKEQRARDLLNGAVDLAVCTHANDLSRMAELGVRAVQIPQTADQATFECHRPFRERKYDCMLSGSVSRPHYPLRVRLQDMVRSGALSGVELPQPGYWIPEDKNVAQLQRYAEWLGNSKVVLCCSSQWKYFLGKPVEALMAGAIPATDWPDDPEFERLIGPYTIRLYPHWSDQDIADYINAWLRDFGDTLQTLAEAGQKVVLNNLTHAHYVERFVSACRDAM